MITKIMVTTYFSWSNKFLDSQISQILSSIRSNGTLTSRMRIEDIQYHRFQWLYIRNWYAGCFSTYPGLLHLL